MVCVVQIGSSMRTSACSTARSTFSWAWRAGRRDRRGERGRKRGAASASDVRVDKLMAILPELGLEASMLARERPHNTRAADTRSS